MTAQSPSAYVLSGLVHAAVVALLLCVAQVMSTDTRAPAKFIEVVAGAGDNWSATEAPALGSPDGSADIKVPNMPGKVPKIDDPAPAPPTPEPPAPEPQSQPQPAAPEPEPVPVAPAPEPKPVITKAPEPKTQPPKKADPADILDRKKTLADDAKNRAAKREAWRTAKLKAQQAAEEAAARKAAAEAAKRMTKAEFDKMNQGKGGGKVGAGGKISRVDAKGIAGGVVGGSTSNTKGGAGGKALSVAEQNLLDQYFAALKIKIKAAHVPPPGTDDAMTTTVQFMVSANGAISGVRVSHSSGNREFDQSVVEACRRITSIGPRPDGRSDEVELDFNTKDD